MLESYLGEEVFRKGVNNYLTKHSWGNTSAHDFTEALATTAGKPVDEIMNSYIKQPGVPLVSLSSRCESGRSEERRVGKEGGAGGWRHGERKEQGERRGRMR